MIDEKNLQIRKIDGTHTSIEKVWRRFLQDMTLLRETIKARSVPGSTVVPPSPILSVRVPSILYIELCAFFHESLKEYYSKTRPSTSIPSTLASLIETLKTDLANHSACVDLKKKRNELAHEIEKSVNWHELDTAVDKVHDELKKLHSVGPMPKYDYFLEKNREETSDEKLISIFRWEEGLKLDGQRVYISIWREQLHKSST